MDIYIKPVKKAILYEVPSITIKDIAEVLAPTNISKKIEKIKLLDIDMGGVQNSKKKTVNLLVSVTDIVKAIMKAYPDATVCNLGEMDTLINYSLEKKEESTLFKYLKIFFVVLVLFAGGSTAIMSFHTDAQISQVLEKYYEIFFGKITTKPMILDIPYSIGLAVGIIVFFNHFLGKKITDDPTPIEVEMALYETNVTDTTIEILDIEKKAKENNLDDKKLKEDFNEPE